MLLHLLVIIAVGAMCWAGLWQWSRHGQRQARNDLIEARSLQPPQQLHELLDADIDFEAASELEYEPVVATGRFQIEDEVLIRNRTFDGAPGYWVITPLLLDQGFAVAVNRGWVPHSAVTELSSDPANKPSSPQLVLNDPYKPSTEVETISGFLRPSRRAETFQSEEPETGKLKSMSRPDIERLAQQLEYEIAPIVLQLTAESDAAESPSSSADSETTAASTSDISASSPQSSDASQRSVVPLRLAELGSGPHLGYMAQWFIFATIAAVGYPLLLRRQAQGRQKLEYIDTPLDVTAASNRTPHPE